MPAHEVLAYVLTAVISVNLIGCATAYYGAKREIRRLMQLYQVILGIVVSNRELKQELLEEVTGDRVRTVHALTERIRKGEAEKTRDGGSQISGKESSS